MTLPLPTTPPETGSEEGLLPLDPPPWVSRVLVGFCLALLAAVGALVLAVKIPQFNRCPFVLLPDPETGVLVARLSLAEDDFRGVAHGQSVVLSFDGLKVRRGDLVRSRIERVVRESIAPGDERWFGYAALEPAMRASSGSRLRLEAGQRGEARVLIRRATLFDYLFRPLEEFGDALAEEDGSP